MPTPAAIDSPPAKPQEIREQRVKDPQTGRISTIRVKILRGGRRATPQPLPADTPAAS